MRYKVPNIPIHSGLSGIDKRVQEIQIKMGEITWLQYSFGLCQAVLKDDEGDEIAPVCFVSETSDPLDVRPWPDDSWNSYSFWDLIDPVEPDYGDNFSFRKYPVLNYTVACIVVVHLDKVSGDWKVGRSQVRHDLLEFFHQDLRFSGTFQISGMWEKSIEEIFDGYDIVDPLLVLRDNTAAFRIEGLVTFKQDCD
jgi:hypothetical protein